MCLHPSEEEEEEEDCYGGNMLFMDMPSEGARGFRVPRFFSRAETDETFLGQVEVS